MKEKIYTIPINDAFSADSECPLCEFLKKEEQQKIEYSLGASMMEPDARISSNENGYCNHHTEMMYRFGNKLSHALVLETRLAYIEDMLKSASDTLKKQTPKKLTLGKSRLKEGVKAEGEKLLKTVSSCLICEQLDKILNAFTDNMFYLYKNDSVFKEKFFITKGFCFKHFQYILNESVKHLNDEQEYEFANRLLELEIKNIVRVKDDVNWFTKKFDYRYKNEDWKNSRDAVKRGCEKTAMYINEDNE